MTPAKCNGPSVPSDRSGETTTRETAPGRPFALASLRTELESHVELDLATLIYHIEQSDATATDGYWHASVNEARSALESLLFDIGRAVLPAEKESLVSGSTPFSNCRKALVVAGFLEQRESEILQLAYSLSSAKGSHPGVTDEAWCRLSRQIVFSITQYLLGRYGEWKRYRPSAAVSAGTARPHGATFGRLALRRALHGIANVLRRR